MKHFLLLLMTLCSGAAIAQTTHQINWNLGVTQAESNITIDVGDTVMWIWTDGAPHTVTSLAGSTQSFDSGSQNGAGATFSVTFTQEGTNDYQCNFHPGNMNGTITVTASMSTKEILEQQTRLTYNALTRKISYMSSMTIGEIELFNTLGQQVRTFTPDNTTGTLSADGLTTGLYLIRIKAGSEVVTKKLMLR